MDEGLSTEILCLVSREQSLVGPMTNETLINSFLVLETRLGLQRMSDVPLVFENETHRISISIGDCHSTVTCGVALKALPKSLIDGYSIISFYNAQALDAFLRAPQKRTDEVVADFIAREISGPCAAVFKVNDTSAWMRLHQHFLQSMRRRNDVFGARVSGFDEGSDLSEHPTY